jgi:hypothetical protein
MRFRNRVLICRTTVLQGTLPCLVSISAQSRSHAQCVENEHDVIVTVDLVPPMESDVVEECAMSCKIGYKQAVDAGLSLSVPFLLLRGNVRSTLQEDTSFLVNTWANDLLSKLSIDTSEDGKCCTLQLRSPEEMVLFQKGHSLEGHLLLTSIFVAVDGTGKCKMWVSTVSALSNTHYTCSIQRTELPFEWCCLDPSSGRMRLTEKSLWPPGWADAILKRLRIDALSGRMTLKK